MPKGGVRKGAGRPPKPDALKTSPFRFQSRTIERIRELVEETGKIADELIWDAINQAHPPRQ